jgi:hypothetical protein
MSFFFNIQKELQKGFKEQKGNDKEERKMKNLTSPPKIATLQILFSIFCQATVITDTQ